MSKIIKVLFATLALAAVVFVSTTMNGPPTMHVQWFTHHETEQQAENSLKILSDEVQAKIWARQNPENCSEARLLVYDIHSWYSGFASTSHLIAMHFLLAFYANRTFVLRSEGWAYDEKGWDHFFMPLGKCNYNGTVKSLPQISGKPSNVRILRTVNRFMFGKYSWKVPRNILQRLKQINNTDPYTYWVGQFIQYQLRFRPWFKEILADRSLRVPLTSSTVGLHIRWGDKIGREATKHPVSEYMKFAAEWFGRPEYQGLNKSAFVATEHSEAWKNLEDNFHGYSFMGSGYVTRDKQMNIKNNDRYAERKNELDVVLTDIYFLSKCPYVVCTFSSNLCRLIYELVASHNNNPQSAITSLDDTFYWLIAHPRFRVIDESHEGGMDLKIGDIFTPASEAFKPRKYGYILGKNSRTGKQGRVPEHKVEAVVEPLNFDV